jgi:superfamily II DNA/RNA helicase
MSAQDGRGSRRGRIARGQREGQAMNVEAEEHARQVRLRAERRAGELLRESRNIHPADRSSPATDLPPKLSDLGITKKESSDWQTTGRNPQGRF